MTRLWAAGEPVQVVVGPIARSEGSHDDGMPVRFQLQGEWHEVAFIANRWRVQTAWWLPEAEACDPRAIQRIAAASPTILGSREYVKLASTDGLLCILYRAIPGSRDPEDRAILSTLGSRSLWYCARVYD